MTRAIAALNADPSVDGIIVQMPLPPSIRLRAVVEVDRSGARTSTASTRSTRGCFGSATTASCRRRPTPRSRSCAGRGSRSRAVARRDRPVGRRGHAGRVPAGPRERDRHGLPHANPRSPAPRQGRRDRGRRGRPPGPRDRADAPPRRRRRRRRDQRRRWHDRRRRRLRVGEQGRLGDHARPGRRRAAHQCAAADPPRPGGPGPGAPATGRGARVPRRVDATAPAEPRPAAGRGVR